MTDKLFAHVKIKISGQDKSRFVNAAIKSDIKFWKYKSLNNCYQLCVKAQDYQKLARLRKNYNVSIKRISKAGLPIWLKKYKYPWGIVSGIAVGIVLYLFMYSFYWVIQVPENGYYTSEEILAVAKEAGVYVGAKKSTINPKLVAYEIMLELPNLQWVSVNNDGCKIEIVLTYIEEIPEMIKEEDVVSNLVASKTGIIRFIEVQEGMVEVMADQAVIEGEILVTGIWDTNRGYEEWELKENPSMLYANSRGIIMAETMCSYDVSISDTNQLYKNEKTYNKYTLGFFGLKFSFTPSLVPKGNYSLSINQENFNLLGTTLPIYLSTQSLTKLSAYEEIVSQDKAKEVLEILLFEKIEEELGELGQVISMEEINYSYENGVYTASVNCVCLENIAISQKIAIN